MLIKPIYLFSDENDGYIAGDGDGIATVGGEPAARMIYLLDAHTLKLLQIQRSLENGHYMFTGLDKDKEYIVMIRDYERVYEPTVFDVVKAAADLTAVQQRALWKSWQK